MIGRYSEIGLNQAYYQYDPQRIAAATVVASGLLLWNGVVPIYMTESGPEISEGVHGILQKLEANRCHCGATRIQIPTELSWLQRRVLGLLVADSPRTVRAFPYAKSQITDAVCQLVKFCSIWEDKNCKDTVSFGNAITLTNRSVSSIQLQHFKKIAFTGAKVEMRAAYLYLDGAEPRSISLGWSWLGTKEEYTKFFGSGFEFLKRPDWPAELNNTDFHMIDGVIEACNSFISSSMAAPEGIWSNSAFFVTVVSTQLAEVDWWLATHEVPLGACETYVLLDEIEGGSNNDDPIDPSRTAVRALLILRAVLVAMLCWDALDISPYFDNELGNQVVLLK